MNFIFFWNSNSNSFLHFKLSDFHSYFELNQRSASKIELFLSKNPHFWISLPFEIQTVIDFCISNCQIFILTLNWIKYLHLKFSCFSLLSKNPCFWITSSFESQTIIAFGISNCQSFILTLNWTKDLHLKFICFCLLSLKPRF